MKTPAVQLILTAVFVLAANLMLLPAARSRPDRDPSVDRTAIDMLNARHPVALLLGDSIVDSGVGPNLFSRLSGVPTEKYASHGSATAWWYLALKNVVGGAEHRPRVVMIFFRDDHLTQPTRHVRGNYTIDIDAIATGDEPVLDRLAYGEGSSATEHLISRHAPVVRLRHRVADLIDSTIKTEVIPAIQPRTDAAAASARVFAADQLDEELYTQQQFAADREGEKRAYDFEAVVDDSFLPEMIKVAEDLDVRLCFIRLKMRRDLKPNAQPAGLPEYIDDLRAYLNDHNVPMVDFTDDPRLLKKYYADGNHLDPKEGKRVFTAMVAEAMTPLWPELLAEEPH